MFAHFWLVTGYIFLYRNNDMLDNICSHVTGPLDGTLDCSCYVVHVYMLPALHRLALGTLTWSDRSLVRGWLPRVFCCS